MKLVQMKYTRITLFLLMLLALVGCQGRQKTLPSTTIFVTVSPYDMLVQRIVGQTAEVKAVVPPGGDLHTYEPTPKMVAQMRNGDLWITIGEPIEKAIPFKERFTLSGGDTEDHHYWMSPAVVKVQMRAVTKKLSELYPNNYDLYQENLAELEDELTLLQRELHAILDPIAGATFIINHPALNYFCEEFDLIQLSIEEHGKSPHPGHLENLLKEAKEQRARCVLVQEGGDSRGAKLIAKRLVIPIHYFDTNAPDYFKNLLSIARDIRSQ
ncbi:MAG: zinc ABC transporter substrate-binding protein [Simkaniaceae bacterium]|nr:zinc ABC transporter substrate-binding protein [Simkaniaceae bacterium]